MFELKYRAIFIKAEISISKQDWQDVFAEETSKDISEPTANLLLKLIR
jgi:hypothetical protein